jgi:bleomycin hydrolase
MKNTILSTVFIAISAITYSQFGYTEPASNAPNSDYKFTKIVHLDATPVEDQGNTGTCWSFSGLSFFESELMRMGNPNPDLLSEMYVARKAYEGKAIKYIRMDGKGNFSQGGETHDIPYVIKNYGIVPLEVYSGINYSSDEHDHDEMYSVLNGAMQGLLKHLKSRRSDRLTTAWKTAMSGILDAYFGEDVQEFEFKGKEYTPKSYAKSIGLEMDDYVAFTSFSSYPLNQECMLEIPDNWSWGKSYNVSLDDLADLCERAVKEGFTIAWTADVSEEGFNHRKGLAINPADPATLELSKEEDAIDAFNTPVEEVEVSDSLRQAGYDDKSTTDDHLMHIVGLYKDQNKTRYFLVKNSWGTDNFPDGFLYVSESYFKWKTINVYLHKDGISKVMSKKLGI